MYVNELCALLLPQSYRARGFFRGSGRVHKIRVTTSGVERVFNLARPCNTSKRTKYVLGSPAKKQVFASIESIFDGSAFPAE